MLQKTPTSLEHVLEINNFSMRYSMNASWTLQNLDLIVAPREKLALVGSSGSGKSTIAKLIMQLLPKEAICSGELLVGGLELTEAQPIALTELRGTSVGLVFQDPMTRLNPLMTAGEHLIDTFVSHNPDSGFVACKERAEELLTKVGIDIARFNAYPHELSGGMRQRLAIALAIAFDPPLLIADEPTTSLDVSIAHQIMNELSSLCSERGTALLLITHDLALASTWCDEIAVLSNGKIVEKGPSTSFILGPKSNEGKRLVSAARNREKRNIHRTSDICSKLVLEVNNMRCWHYLEGLPWNVNWLKAVNEVSFYLHSGETLGLVGESGCGKSTLCRALMGLIPIRGGQVNILGENILDLKGNLLREARRNIQMVFQDPFASLNPKMNISECISDPLLMHSLISRSRAKEIARDLLNKVGLGSVENILRRFPHELSGGQQQRVAIARALALEPKVLICDESFSMIDSELQIELLNLLSNLQQELGIAILFITHDLNIAAGFCDRVIVLDDGKIVEEGDSKIVFNYPQMPITRKLVATSPRLPLL